MANQVRARDLHLSCVACLLSRVRTTKSRAHASFLSFAHFKRAGTRVHVRVPTRVHVRVPTRVHVRVPTRVCKV